jgi:hypothetical protein
MHFSNNNFYVHVTLGFFFGTSPEPIDIFVTLAVFVIAPLVWGFGGYDLVKRAQYYFATWSAFRRDNRSAEAAVIRKYRRTKTDSEGMEYQQYYVVIKFETDSRACLLKAEVKKGVYEKYSAGKLMQVRCAKKNPTIAVLEGEKAF